MSNYGTILMYIIYNNIYNINYNMGTIIRQNGIEDKFTWPVIHAIYQ